jgi:16S rRNA (guanine966-N2)-methyltransferase
VEADTRAAQVIKANIAAVALPGARVVTDRVERMLSHGPREDRYDLAFADPPYALSAPAIAAMLSGLGDGWLDQDALVVVERATRSGPVDWPPGYSEGKSRRYGEATFWYGWYGTGAAAGQAGQPQAAVPEPADEE